MTSSPSLNRYTPHRWARVVSGETWAEYGVGLSGQVEAKTLRGPLIVWATKPGEGEDLPRLKAPTPSPLEVEAARVNRKAHFLAFVRAAHGKVRASVRWKTVKRVRRQVLRKQIVILEKKYLSLCWIFAPEEKIFDSEKWSLTFYQAFTDPSIWITADRFTLGMFSRRKRVRVAAERREQKEIYAHKIERSKRGYVEPEYGHLEGEDKEKRLLEIQKMDDRLSRILKALHSNFIPDTQDLLEMSREDERTCPVICLMTTLGPKFAGTSNEMYAALFRILREMAGFKSIKDTLLLRSLEAAAFRAHVTRRVRPPARRARIPRPIHARPRPPTAPLAPPVTC